MPRLPSGTGLQELANAVRRTISAFACKKIEIIEK